MCVCECGEGGRGGGDGQHLLCVCECGEGGEGRR